MNLKHYDKEFQARAIRWWRSLSITKMKAFEKVYRVAGNMASRSEIAEIFDREGPK